MRQGNALRRFLFLQMCIRDSPCVVAINAFPTDTQAELALIEEKCKEAGVNVALSEVWAKGGEGGIKLAEEVIRLCDEPSDFHYSYELEGTIEDKINQIVQKIYGGKGAVLLSLIHI